MRLPASGRHYLGSQAGRRKACRPSSAPTRAEGAIQWRTPHL